MKIINCNRATANETESQVSFYDKDICQRHILAFGTEMQERTSQLIVGIGSVGGLGMELVELLMRLFPAKIILIDFDRVDKSNLNRLTGATTLDARLSIPKTTLAARHILNFNPNQEVVIVEGNFLEKENQLQFCECDFFFSCFDRIGPRLAANQLCQAHGITLFDLGTGAVVKDGRLTEAGGQIIRIVPGNGLCLSCGEFDDKAEAAQDFMSADELTRQRDLGYIRGANITAPQVYALNTMVASWAVWVFMRAVSGEELDFDGIAIDALNWTTRFWKEERASVNHCPICGDKGLAFQGDDAELLVRSDMSRTGGPSLSGSTLVIHGDTPALHPDSEEILTEMKSDAESHQINQQEQNPASKGTETNGTSA